MAEVRPDGQYALWDGSDWNILNGPPGNMTEFWQPDTPTNGGPGARWIDSASGTEHAWDRDLNHWVPISGGGGGGSSGHVIKDEGLPLVNRTAIDFVGGGVTAVDDPANDRTVVTITGTEVGLDRVTADSLYVNVSGDLITGNLGISGSLTASTVATNSVTLGADPDTAMKAATKQYVDANKGGQPHAIKDESSAALTARANLRFVGPAIAATDDAAGDATVVTVSTPNMIVLGPSDAIPGGTPIGTIVIRTI